jgi:peptidoglycan/xylan/chitin deacetylase (PgdA/CDA1 family)/glycosyltransferase involved in cell wall biosynthesis
MNCSQHAVGRTEMSLLARIKASLKTAAGEAIYRSGAFLLLRKIHRRIFGSGIRILFYHRVTADAAPPDIRGRQLLTAHEFERHLKHLRRHYDIISLADAVQALQSGASLPQNTVVITFDDGYRDNYTVALPLLEKYKAPATVFVVTSAIDGEPLWFDDMRRWFEQTKVETLRMEEAGEEFSLADATARRKALEKVLKFLKSVPGSRLPALLADLRNNLKVGQEGDGAALRETLSWDELRALASSDRITIGAHTVTHPILPNLEPEEIAREIRDSVEVLSRRLARPIQFFAYPNGDCNVAARRAVREMNLVACSVGGGGFNPPGSDLTALSRLGAEGLPFFRFALYLVGWENLAPMLLRRLRSLLRRAKRIAYAGLEALGIFALLRRVHRQRLVVLLYHGVPRPGGMELLDNLHVPEQKFRRQVRWLRRKFTPVTLDEAIAGLEGRASLPDRPALVTFDDAYRNNLDVAAPILAELDIPAVLFVPVKFVGVKEMYWNEELEARVLTTSARAVKLPVPGGQWLWLRNVEERRSAYQALSSLLKAYPPEYRDRLWADVREQLSGSIPDAAREPRLSWKELGELRSHGFAIGSHTVSHALLTSLPAGEVAEELERSKSQLEERLGTAVAAFAYPNGDWNSEVRQSVERAGYRCAFTVEAGGNDHLTDRFLLRRVSINATMSFSEFVAGISGFARLGTRWPPKIAQVSNYPPPHCGWAMQTKLLTEELRRRGAVCEVLNINPENRRIKSREYVDIQNGLDYFAKIVKFSFRGYRFQTHVNGESPKGYLLALFAHLMGRIVRRPAVMTFHGGLPQTYFPRTDSRMLRFAFRLLFESAGSITCDNEEMKQAIQSYGTNGRPIAPFACFSSQYLKFQKKPLPAEIERFLEAHSPVFFCYVSFRPEYALEELRKGTEFFTRQVPRAGFIWLGFPAKELPHAEAYLNRIPGGQPENVLLLGNLDHDLFLSLLMRCFAYVRPPACDGISASVLESLALGVPVIAAENGRRPPGVVTYRFADPEDLCAKLCYVVQNYEAVKRAARLEKPEDAVERAAQWLLDTAAVS